MNRCYLSLGSNQKYPERQIRQALEAIKKQPRTVLIRHSPLDWNKAWGFGRQQDFCNVLVEINTLLSPLKLLFYCQAIEKQQGRVRKKRWGPRTLDIDIISYGKQTIKSPKITIPHPYALQRDFVHIPLKKMNPNHELLKLH